MKVQNWKNTRIYKVEHTLEVKERSQNKKSHVTFDMGISCRLVQGENPCRIFTKENYQINAQSPNDHHIRLLCDLEQALYPLPIEVTPEEDYVKIPAYEQWRADWRKRAGERIQDTYEGNFAKSLKDQYEEAVATEAKLKQKIQEEAFWRLYFLDISEERQNRPCRWNILKIGTLYFVGSVQTKTEENEWISHYAGIPEEWEENCIENLNRLLHIKKYTAAWLTPEKLEADCRLTARWERGTGKLLAKTAAIHIRSTDEKYTYSEKIEINYHSISMRTIPNPRSFTFFLSEKQEETLKK